MLEPSRPPWASGTDPYPAPSPSSEQIPAADGRQEEEQLRVVAAGRCAALPARSPPLAPAGADLKPLPGEAPCQNSRALPERQGRTPTQPARAPRRAALPARRIVFMQRLPRAPSFPPPCPQQKN